jgi:glycosyltransferase involved in cell wall biosynthesis
MAYVEPPPAFGESSSTIAAQSTRRRTVALVMPARNEEHSVGPTLDAVFASTRLPDEIIIADGYSVDRTVERVQTYMGRGVPIQVVPNPQIFAGAGRNRAAAVAASDILLFLDFGNLVHPRWIEQMTRPFEEDLSVDAVGGAFAPHVESDFEHCVACIQYQEMMLFSRFSRSQKLAHVPKEFRLGGLGTAISRECYRRLGGMPAWLRAAEDKLFGYKLLRVRARIVPAVDALLYHHIRKNVRTLFMQNFVYARGDGHIDEHQPHYRRTAFFYTVVILAVGYGAIHPATLPVPLLMLAAHLYRAGVRPLKKVDGRVVRLRYLLRIPLVVLAKDMGALLGYPVGLFDWFTKPRYRHLFQGYMRRV